MSNGNEDTDLSFAWARAFLSAHAHGVKEVSPLVVKIPLDSDGMYDERSEIRRALDRELKLRGKSSVQTVANTMFPSSMWEGTRQDLYTRYLKAYPRIKTKNPYGTYFQRLIAYGQDGDAKQGPNAGGMNQLEHIIETYKRGNRRRSALQALIFDPRRDHTHQPRRGFPCLQQVTFLPIDESGLKVTGVYTLQYLFERAYGNYEGLWRLGTFVAHELGLKLSEIVCVALVALYAGSDVSKLDLQAFSEEIKGFLSKQSEPLKLMGAT